MKRKATRAKFSSRKEVTMKARKKSALARRAEKLFVYRDSEVIDMPELFSDDVMDPTLVTVQTFTTYSVCEPPIPDLRKQSLRTVNARLE